MVQAAHNILNYVSTSAENVPAMAEPVGPVPAPMLLDPCCFHCHSTALQFCFLHPTLELQSSVNTLHCTQISWNVQTCVYTCRYTQSYILTMFCLHHKCGASVFLKLQYRIRLFQLSNYWEYVLLTVFTPHLTCVIRYKQV